MSSELHILHLEDSRMDAELVREILDRAGIATRIERVDRRDTFVRALERAAYDVILADYALPMFDGLSALELAQSLRPEVPFVFVTGALKDDNAVETLRRGATDFIVKQRLERLVPAIHRALREREEQRQRAKAEAALALLAEASGRLASSLDLKATLGNIARLAIPAFADWCVAKLATDSGEQFERVAAAHVEPGKMSSLHEITFRVDDVLRAGACHLYEQLTEAMLVSLVERPEHVDLLRRLAPTSMMFVPMVVKGRVLGVIVFGFGESRRRYDARDLATAQNVAERAAVAVENARLHRELQGAVKAREDLLAIVSHDLRGPMQSILMTAWMMQKSLAAHDPMRARLDSIVKSAELLERLVSDLLDLARFDAGGLVLARQEQDLAQLVSDSIDVLVAQAEVKAISLVNAVRGRDLVAYCDATRVRQILCNLIGNAIKFTPRGGTIVIGAERVPDQPRVRVHVADTGSGIAEADLRHVFERYWQASASTGVGVGLGLAIVKALVEAHGGTVQVASTSGQGTTFSFTLPVSLEPAAQAPAQRAPRVLVVDDDADIRITVGQVLEDAGYSVLTAGNGLDALAILRAEPQLRPAAVILDIMMPEMDARQFRDIQQRDVELAAIPVIVVSAYEDIEEIGRTLNAAAALRKPIRAQELLEVLARLVGAPAERSSVPVSA